MKFNKNKILEILENVEKMIVKSLNVPIKIEDLFPISEISDNKVYYNDASISYFFEVIPISIDGLNKEEYEKLMKKTTEIFNVLDDDTLITFLVKSDDVKPDIEKEYLKNKKDNKFIEMVVDSKYNYIKNKKFLKYYISIKLINITEDRKGFHDLETFEKIANEKMITIVDLLKKDFEIKKLPEVELVQLADYIFNPQDREEGYVKSGLKQFFENYEYSLTRSLSRTYIKDDGNKLEFNDSYGRVFNLLRPPANENPISIFTIVEYLNSVTDINYLINFTFRKAPEAISKIKRKVFLGKSKLAETFEDTNILVSESGKSFLEFLDKKHYEPVAVSFAIGIISDSLEELKLNSKKVKKPFEWKNSVIVQNNFTSIQEWFALFPGIYNKGFYDFYTSTYHASYLTNLVSPLNTNSKNYFMFFEDKRGNLVNYNFLTENHTLFGGIIFAPPGKGKSALLNYLYFTYIMKFLQEGSLNSFILDFGGSYKSLISLINYYIEDESKKILYKEVKTEQGTFYNPFDLEYGKPLDNIDKIKEKVGLVLAFIKAGLKDDVNQVEESLLSVAIETTLKKTLIDENSGMFKMKLMENGIDEKPYVEIYNESNYLDQESFLNAMPNLNDLAKVISSDQSIRSTYKFEDIQAIQEKIMYFVATSIGAIFSKNSTQVITGKNMVVDMKPVVQGDSTGFALLLFYLYFVQISWIRFTDHSIKSEKKLYIIDEYNQFASRSEQINHFSRMVYKTGRKENIDLFLASQNISDFPEDFFNSVGHSIMFEPNNQEEINQIKKTIGLSDADVEPLKNIRTIPGSHSELFIISNSNSGKIKTTLRVKITPYEYWAFITTSPKEWYCKNTLSEKFDITIVIKYLSDKYPNGFKNIEIENMEDFIKSEEEEVQKYIIENNF